MDGMLDDLRRHEWWLTEKIEQSVRYPHQLESRQKNDTYMDRWTQPLAALASQIWLAGCVSIQIDIVWMVASWTAGWTP